MCGHVPTCKKMDDTDFYCVLRIAQSSRPAQAYSTSHAVLLMMFAVIRTVADSGHCHEDQGKDGENEGLHEANEQL